MQQTSEFDDFVFDAAAQISALAYSALVFVLCRVMLTAASAQLTHTLAHLTPRYQAKLIFFLSTLLVTVQSETNPRV